MSKSESRTKVSAVPGLAMIGCLLTGVLGLIGGVLDLIGEARTSGPGTAEPMYLIVAALAFGIVAYLSFRE